MKQCYRNAHESVAPNAGKYVLVEGSVWSYSLGHIPHAWFVDRLLSGLALDPTLGRSLICFYFGIPIRFRHAVERVLSSGYYGPVLGDPSIYDGTMLAESVIAFTRTPEALWRWRQPRKTLPISSCWTSTCPELKRFRPRESCSTMV
jgi:hypothetical protein